MLGVVYAFRKLGKPVYEIQHGYIGPSHNAYNNREIVGSKSNFCPSGFVVWDDRTSQFLKSRGASNIEITDFRHLKIFSTAVRKSSATVLFTTQYDTELPDFIDDLIRNNNNVRWKMRIHPQEHDERLDIKRLSIYPNVEISNPETLLADELRHCDLHFTVYSSTVQEAAAMNIVSLFTSEIGKERFRQEIDQGMAIFVDAQIAEQTMRSVLEANRTTSP